MLYVVYYSKYLKQVTPTVKVVGFWVLSIDHNDLPVGFTLIDQSQGSQHLHFDYFSPRAHLKVPVTFLRKAANYWIYMSLFSSFHYLVSNVTDVNRIVVSTASCVTVLVARILPCLTKKMQVIETDFLLFKYMKVDKDLPVE